MKSQDILLLLKLLASAHQGRTPDVASQALPQTPLIAIRNDTVENHNEQEASLIQEWLPAYEIQEPTHYSPFSVRGLAQSTGIGKSEVSNALSRCYFSGLAKPAHSDGPPSVNTKALLEFLVYGIRYVFPVRPQEITRGIATTLTAPVLGNELRSIEQPPVWPYAKGNVAGPAIEPLFKTAPAAALRDHLLYEMLALVDSIRIGLPRERNLAVQKLEILLRS